MTNVVVSIPHAGTDIPDEIKKLISHDDPLLHNESDLFTDQIYDLKETKLVKTPYSRIISDVNRAPDEIYINGKTRATGVVMLDLPTGESVFDPEPGMDVLQTWVDKYHTPFHEALKSACEDADFVIDAHSMWSESVAGHWGGSSAGESRSDVLIGNQYFCSCDAETTQFFVQFFENIGYSVNLNDPYPGRYILGVYCHRDQTPGIQIEFNRALYLDEKTLEPYPEKITKLNQQMQQLITEFKLWWKTHKTADMVDISELATEEGL